MLSQKNSHLKPGVFAVLLLLLSLQPIAGCVDDSESQGLLAGFVGDFAIKSNKFTTDCAQDISMWDEAAGSAGELVRISRLDYEGTPALCLIQCASGVCDKEDCDRWFVEFPEVQVAWEEDTWVAFSGICNVSRSMARLEQGAGTLILQSSLSTAVLEALDNGDCRDKLAGLSDDDWSCIQMEQIILE